MPWKTADVVKQIQFYSNHTPIHFMSDGAWNYCISRRQNSLPLTPLLLTESSWISIQFRPWINHYIHGKQWDVFRHPCPHFKSGFVKPPLTSKCSQVIPNHHNDVGITRDIKCAPGQWKNNMKWLFDTFKRIGCYLWLARIYSFQCSFILFIFFSSPHLSYQFYTTHSS